MERGLFWLPLLALFIGLAWSGWNEYQKVESYQRWAEQFDRAKYDIYSVLGQKGSDLTWGTPTRKGPVNLETFSLADIETIRLVVNGNQAPLDNPPGKGKTALEFVRSDRGDSITIPFTEASLAAKWGQHLQQELSRLQSTL